jgi:hypothetical protein
MCIIMCETPNSTRESERFVEVDFVVSSMTVSLHQLSSRPGHWKQI